MTRLDPVPPAPAPENIPKGNIVDIVFDIKSSSFFQDTIWWV